MMVSKCSEVKHESGQLTIWSETDFLYNRNVPQLNILHQTT